MNSGVRKIWWRAGAFALLGVAACGVERERIAESTTDNQSVRLGQAKSVSIELTMGAGEMRVKGGATSLMDGTFTYNVPAWKPKISSSESGDRGELRIEQPAGAHSNIGNTRYSWDVQLNNHVPLEIHTQMGAGKTNLELGELSLSKLHVEMGAGEATVDLAGNWRRDVEARLEGGVGRATVKLPRSVGVRVTVEGGLGSVSTPDFKKDGDAFVNDEYGKSPVTVKVRVEGGIG